MNNVVIEVPASAANLGPGFDCLALAIELTNNFEFGLQADGLNIQNDGSSGATLPTDDSNLAARAFTQLADLAGASVPGLFIKCQTEVPISSGLGSSSTAVVAGLLAANQLLGLNGSRQDLLAVAAELEGHADNSAAALFGGLVGVHQTESGWNVLRLPLAPLQLVVVVPQLAISTRQMRSALPASLPLEKTVNNSASLLAMQQALAQADFERMRQASLDSFHQEARLPHITGGRQAMAAGRLAGAAVVLAGAGPSLIALAPDNHKGIASAMQAAFKQAGVTAETLIVSSRQHGALILPPG